MLQVPSRPSSGSAPAIRPQDDLFGHVNGPWLATTEFPPDKVMYGTTIELADKVDADLRAIIEETAADRRARRGSLRGR